MDEEDTVTLVATRPMRVGRRGVAVGEAFRTTAANARYLRNIKKAVTPEEAKALGDAIQKPLGSMKLDELKAYAEQKGIDLGDLTKKADILAAIMAAEDGEE